MFLLYCKGNMEKMDDDLLIVDPLVVMFLLINYQFKSKK